MLEQQAAEERADKKPAAQKQVERVEQGEDERPEPAAQRVQTANTSQQTTPPWEEEAKPTSMPPPPSLRAKFSPEVKQLDVAVHTQTTPASVTKPTGSMRDGMPDDMQHVRAEPNSPQARWNSVVRQLQALDALHAFAGQLAVQAQCLAFDENQLHLRVGQEKLCGESAQDKLRGVLTQHVAGLEMPWGGKLQIDKLQWRVERGAVATSYRLEQEAVQTARQQAAEAAFMAMPTVQALMQDWDATVVEGSIKPVMESAMKLVAEDAP